MFLFCQLNYFTPAPSSSFSTPSDKESSPASRGVIQSSLPSSNPFEGVKAEEEEEEEEEGFVDPELPYPVAEDGKEGDLFNMFPSRADEALKTRKHTEQNEAHCHCSRSHF